MENRILLTLLGVFLFFSFYCNAEPPYSPKELFVYDARCKQSRKQLQVILETMRHVYIVGNEGGAFVNISKEGALAKGVSGQIYDYIAGVSDILNHYYDTLTSDVAKKLFVTAFQNGGHLSFKQFATPQYLTSERDKNIAISLSEEELYEIGFTTQEYETLSREIQDLNDNRQLRNSFFEAINHERVRICILVPVDLFSCYADPQLKQSELMGLIDLL